MNHIKRRIKNKIFHDNRCRKLCVAKKRYPKRTKGNAIRPIASKRIVVQAPSELCVFDATVPTLEFFDDVFTKIKQCDMHDTLYFNLSQVKKITPDAVMYLIAIINNTKKLREYQITCEGNMPVDPSAKAVFQDAGFFKFVYAPYSRTLEESTKYMKIQNGTDANSELAAAFCEFVHDNCDKNYIDTKRLYPMIVELMTNTHQHAYHTSVDNDGHLEMDCNWYIFAQDMGSDIRFVFLDTGVGIPRTVAKKFHEVLSDKITLNKDAVYLQSALKGDYVRSETKLTYRGKGLPGIYEDCQNAHIKNLRIISAKAKCVVDNDASINSQNINTYFEGTLFSWDIAK